MLICGKVTNIIQLNKPHYKSFIVQQKKNPATCIQHQRQHTYLYLRQHQSVIFPFDQPLFSHDIFRFFDNPCFIILIFIINKFATTTLLPTFSLQNCGL